MKYLFISDLHIGDGSKADDFGNNDIHFINWLLKMFLKYDNLKVVFVGDVYECWQFKMKDIKRAHAELCRVISDHRVLKGNHDYQLLRRKTMNIRLPGRGYAHVSHGCWNDKDMSNPFIRFGVWLYGLTLEKILPDFENRWSKKFPKSKIYKKTKAYARSILAKDKYKICICGHTHKAEILRLNGKLYANTGSCQSGKFSGAILDTRTADVSIVKSR